MAKKGNSQLASPASTGGAGPRFETQIQALFVTMMLTRGRLPYLPGCSIVEIRLQQKIDGFHTDDLIVIARKDDTGEERRLLAQVTRSVDITKSSRKFANAIKNAWTDFQNSGQFRQGKDQIGLITGPLSKTDIRNVLWLLNHAKSQNRSENFFRNVRKTKFSSAAKIKKLEVFQHHIKNANEGEPVPEGEIFRFLRHFNILGYDLDEEDGVVLPLLLSHITQSTKQAPEPVWASIVVFVQDRNQHAGIITPQALPDSIKAIFQPKDIAKIPERSPQHDSKNPEPNWTDDQKTELALANLIGAWDGQNDEDITSIRRIISSTKNSEWRNKTEGLFRLPHSPLKLRRARFWSIEDRSGLWDTLESHILDHHLDTYKDIAVKVLTERDPGFDLPTEERYAASVHGKIPTYSHSLKEGLANGLAMLGTKPDAKHRSPSKAKNTAASAVYQILSSTDWKLWSSLNRVLPALAEAAPGQFLDIVENTLQRSPCPYDTLFKQEGAGIFGDNYLTGLLWALEGLAWDKTYLTRVCVILGRLAERDPGGSWTNRPGNSLSTILLPWLPQTRASLEQQKTAITAVRRECPNACWNLVTSLLPNWHESSAGSHKPVWRNAVPQDWRPKVTHRDYWKQVDFCADLAIDLAARDPIRLAELVDHIKVQLEPFQECLLTVLSSDEIAQLPDDQKRKIWDSLIRFISKNRQFSSAKWALDERNLVEIEKVAEHLKPSDPMEHFQYLFSGRDTDLYERTDGNREQQAGHLQKRRQAAISEILHKDGALDTNRVIHFARTVESPYLVGFSFAHIANGKTDATVLPKCLDFSDQNLRDFAAGYIWIRYQNEGWPWADGLDRSAWAREQVGLFLCCLPFAQETWERASTWLDDRQDEYWLKTSAHPYHEEGGLNIAVGQLLKYGRPRAAMDCLGRMREEKKPVDISQCVRALLSAIKSTEPCGPMEQHYIGELIRFLQSEPTTPTKDLCTVEWIYLRLLDGEHGNASPKTLEKKLASDPDFFCEAIRLIYHPKDADHTAHESTKAEQNNATNAWHMLRLWKVVPGTKNNGDFDDEKFMQWLQDVKRICTKTGHMEVALTHIGNVLIHSPADPSGLWIRHSVAQELDDMEMEDLRRGYHMGWVNSRDAHSVDPTGKPERKLAKKFRRKSESVEKEGFSRLAATLRELADEYDRNANSIVAEYGTDDS